MPITLYFREGNSDKVYHADIEPAGDGFHVSFAYGRRGATLQTGTKTMKPVSRTEAEAIAAKLITSKIAKGYMPAEDGTPCHATGNEGRDSGVRPQLPNETPRSTGMTSTMAGFMVPRVRVAREENRISPLK